MAFQNISYAGNQELYFSQLSFAISSYFNDIAIQDKNTYYVVTITFHCGHKQRSITVKYRNSTLLVIIVLFGNNEKQLEGLSKDEHFVSEEMVKTLKQSEYTMTDIIWIHNDRFMLKTACTKETYNNSGSCERFINKILTKNIIVERMKGPFSLSDEKHTKLITRTVEFWGRTHLQDS